jgi:hypothetical protein
MSAHRIDRWFTYPLQAVCYAAFIAVVGYFSASPAYVHLPAGEAVVKLSFQHAGQRKEACHERTPEELAKLAPNMRAASVCPRERTPVEVRIEMDGRPLFALVAPPTGLSHDGASTVYRRVVVPAGPHKFVAKLKDVPAGDFNYVRDHAVELGSGRVLIIDFDAKEGGWVFRG